MPTKGTRPTQVRLTDQDKERAERIRDHYGLPSAAAAIRYALQTASKKIPKKKEEGD